MSKSNCMIDGYRIRNAAGRFWSIGVGWGGFKASTEFTRDAAVALVLPDGAVIRMDCDLANEFIHAGELEVGGQGILPQDWMSLDGRLEVYTEIINHGSHYIVSVDDEIVVSTRAYSQALRYTLLHLYGEVIV